MQNVVGGQMREVGLVFVYLGHLIGHTQGQLRTQLHLFCNISYEMELVMHILMVRMHIWLDEKDIGKYLKASTTC